MKIVVELCEACERRAIERYGKGLKLKAGTPSLQEVEIDPERSASLRSALQAAVKIGEHYTDDFIRQSLHIMRLVKEVKDACRELESGRMLQALQRLHTLVDDPSEPGKAPETPSNEAAKTSDPPPAPPPRTRRNKMKRPVKAVDSGDKKGGPPAPPIG